MARARVGEFDVWFDEADAEAPLGEVTEVAPGIRVAVEPGVDGLGVGVKYRRADGVWQRMRLRPSTDVGSVRYFEGSFPELRPGERVDYFVEVRCTGTLFLPERQAGDRLSFTVASRESASVGDHAALDMSADASTETISSPAASPGLAPRGALRDDVTTALADRATPRELSKRYGESAEDINPDFVAQELAPRLAGRPADGVSPHPTTSAPTKVVWVEDGDEVLVHLDETTVRVVDRTVFVSVPLETTETGKTPLVVALAMGDPDDPAGLVCMTNDLPYGDPRLAARWGRSLQTAVWSGLLGIATDHAGERGAAPRGLAVREGALHLTAADPLRVEPLVRP